MGKTEVLLAPHGREAQKWNEADASDGVSPHACVIWVSRREEPRSVPRSRSRTASDGGTEEGLEAELQCRRWEEEVS